MSTTINIKALAAEHNFAQLIEGFGGGEPRQTVTLTLGDLEVAVRVGSDFVEIRFPGAASVTIERPHRFIPDEPVSPARVSFSSSSSNDRGYKGAHLTAQVLEFAAGVAAMLDLWATTDQLPRLRPDAVADDQDPERGTDCTVRPGSIVDVQVFSPGGSRGRLEGTLRGEVVAAGIEFDVALQDGADDLFDVMRRCDVDLADLPVHDGRFVLCNCQREQLTTVAS